jgi:hypothetical protein
MTHWFRPAPLPHTVRLAYYQRFTPAPKPVPSWRVVRETRWRLNGGESRDTRQTVSMEETHMDMMRQGDVLVTRVARRARKGEQVTADGGRVVLAHGEVTGHAHVVQVEDGLEMPAAQLFTEPDGTRYLFVDRPCALVHEEHGPIALAPGCYRVTRQREYSPEAIRTVAD